jgi:signal transduction histidine kinase
MSVVQALADANFKANGMPIGIVDANDGAILVGVGWQDVCVRFHRANPDTLERCRQSDAYITGHLSEAEPCEYVCKNGLRDIGIPIRVAGEHVATLFLGQFFYEDEAPDREFFVQQARQFGFDETSYLAAVDRVPVFSRATVKNILEYNGALARFIAALAEQFRERLRTEHELSDAVHARDLFLTAASHELKTPLTSVQLVLESLERQIEAGRLVTAAQVAAKLPNIKRQTARLAYLIAEMFEASRFSQGQLSLRLEESDLVEIVRDVVARFESEIQASGSHVAVKTDGPVRGRWDALRVDQVVTNLVSNALKFGAGSAVSITVAHEDDAAVVEVADGGIGIAPDKTRKIFERFETTEAARAYGGLGLGLWIAESIVAAHAGTIKVESELGAGSTFTVRLPRNPPS